MLNYSFPIALCSPIFDLTHFEHGYLLNHKKSRNLADKYFNFCSWETQLGVMVIISKGQSR